MLVDDEGVPVGWEYVTLGDDLEDFCDAAEAGDMETVDKIVRRAYERAYARLGADIIEGQL